MTLPHYLVDIHLYDVVQLLKFVETLPLVLDQAAKEWIIAVLIVLICLR